MGDPRDAPDNTITSESSARAGVAIVDTKRARAEARALSVYVEGRLGEVVADVAEDVLQLAAEEDHGDDDRDGDNGNDECVLDQTLAFVVTEE
jgi:hypothetical protein